MENGKIEGTTLLIDVLKQEQDKLIAKVDKNDFEINHASGVLLHQNGITLGQAKSVIENIKKFKKDSRKFASSPEKVAIHKKLLELFCENTKMVKIEAEKNAKIQLAFDAKDAQMLYNFDANTNWLKKFNAGYFGIVIFLFFLCFLLLSFLLIDYDRDFKIAFIITAMIFLIIFFYNILSFYFERKKIIKKNKSAEYYYGILGFNKNKDTEQRRQRLIFNNPKSNCYAEVGVDIIYKNDEAFINALNDFTLEALRENGNLFYLLSRDFNNFDFNPKTKELDISDNVIWGYKVADSDVVILSKVNELTNERATLEAYRKYWNLYGGEEEREDILDIFKISKMI